MLYKNNSTNALIKQYRQILESQMCKKYVKHLLLKSQTPLRKPALPEELLIQTSYIQVNVYVYVYPSKNQLGRPIILAFHKIYSIFRFRKKFNCALPCTLDLKLLQYVEC